MGGPGCSPTALSSLSANIDKPHGKLSSNIHLLFYRAVPYGLLYFLRFLYDYVNMMVDAFLIITLCIFIYIMAKPIFALLHIVTNVTK